MALLEKAQWLAGESALNGWRDGRVLLENLEEDIEGDMR